MILSMHRDLPRLEKGELLARLGEGHAARITVATPNRRLAQALRGDFDRAQVACGRSTWETADILPFDAVVERIWDDALYSEIAAEMPVLLGAVQERALWRQAVSAHRPEGKLFSVEAAAGDCAEAWKLAHAWRVEMRAGPAWNDDARAFLEWSEHFRRATREAGHTDKARLPDVVAPHLGHASVRRPRTLVLYGFDMLAPQLRDFLEALQAAGTTILVAEPTLHESVARRVALTQSRDEIVAAARWARARLEANPSARIGVVVPNLAHERARVHRIFANVLDPGHWLASSARVLPFDLSLGVALAELPLVADALRMLSLAGRAAPFEDVSRIVRSPYVAGGESERDLRARVDVHLRRHCPPSVSLESLRRQCGSSRCPPAPVLIDRIERLGALRKKALAGSKGPAEWAKAFSDALKAMGFPGERSLDSAEHQALARWHELLAEFATIERVSAPMPFEDARRILASMAADAIFQPEAPEVPIQVLGVLESAGLEFDHLWVMGLTDDAWPLPARPNPFLPVRLQRAAGIPQADPISSLDLDRRITEGWRRAADEVVVSHARMRDESELAPSPLVAAIEETTLDALAVAPLRTLRDAIHSTGRFETIDDPKGPPPAQVAVPSGGTRLFKEQAACPFRAFAHVRLASERMESPQPGLDPRDRGTLVHCMLAAVWRELKSLEALLAIQEPELERLLAACADEAIAQVKRYRHDALSGRFGVLEHERLVKTARDWLAIERQREDFEVEQIEQKHALEFGGVGVNVKIDRVDRFANGERAVLDYKTGDCSASSWLGERPAEPQLPMYALGTSSVAAVAFAQVKAGQMAFKGFARDDKLLPKVSAVGKGAAKRYASWPQLLQAMRVELDAIGKGFASGDARVDPKKGAATCGTCDQQMACRIAERAPFGGIGAVEADE